jgi:hypothetical protein
MVTLKNFSINPTLCFFFASSSLFFPSTLSARHQQLALYAMTINDERRVTLSFSASCPSLSYHAQHLPFASLLVFFS